MVLQRNLHTFVATSGVAAVGSGANLPSATRGGGRQAGIDKEITEIDLAQGQTERQHEQAFRERSHDLSEGGADQGTDPQDQGQSLR